MLSSRTSRYSDVISGKALTHFWNLPKLLNLNIKLVIHLVLVVEAFLNQIIGYLTLNSNSQDLCGNQPVIMLKNFILSNHQNTRGCDLATLVLFWYFLFLRLLWGEIVKNSLPALSCHWNETFQLSLQLWPSNRIR